MERQKLIELFDEMLGPLGFRRRGNNWISNGPVISRVVNLQRSSFGDLYYVNYGYILNELPLQGFKTHVEKRLGSMDRIENVRIGTLLDLDQAIEDGQRLRELRHWIHKIIVEEMQSVETEEQVYKVLKSMPFRYTIPPFVLEHFKLSVQSEYN